MLNVNTIVVINKSKILEGGFVFGRMLKLSADDSINFFGNSFVIAGESEIIDLAQKENLVTFVGGLVDGFIMCGGFEVEFIGSKDGVDVGFPEVA